MADSTDIRDEGRPDEIEPGPDGPTELSRPSLKAVVLRTVKEFQKDNITDWAAALTYYAVLSVFPALIVLVALLGLFGQPDTLSTLIDIVRQLAPSAADAFEGAIRPIVAEKGTAGALLGVGMAGAIWTASGYVGAFIRATNAIYEVDEGRPFYKLYPLQMALTVAMLLLLAIVAIALAISGPVAEAIGGVLGLGDLAVTVWGIAKWPVILMIVIGIFAVLYYVSPNVRPPRFRWFTPGALVAVLGWILASVAFAVYAANFSSYNATYGSIGGVIAFLVWLWISNLAFLFGAELNAEVERARELEAGLPAQDAIQLPFRADPHPPAKSEG